VQPQSREPDARYRPNYGVVRLLRSGCRENNAMPIAISASSTADAM
jgi:hypothetical protein